MLLTWKCTKSDGVDERGLILVNGKAVSLDNLFFLNNVALDNLHPRQSKRSTELFFL